MDEAVALLELDSVATGLSTVDALTKRALVDVWGAGVVEPGKYVVVVTGPLAEVQESWEAAHERARTRIVDSVLIPYAHPSLGPGLRGHCHVATDADCVGVIETTTLASALEACDRSVKDADVVLAGLRLQPGLGGRGYYAVVGIQHDVEAAIQVAIERVGDRIHRTELIPRPTAQLLGVLLSPGLFHVRSS